MTHLCRKTAFFLRHYDIKYLKFVEDVKFQKGEMLQSAIAIQENVFKFPILIPMLPKKDISMILN